MTHDILIRHGTLIDGSASPGTIGDIALLAGRIVAIGPSLAGDANRVIDAEGLAVTPGFIDIKTHSDFVLPINPKAESKVRQGVTTEIIGHCGFSVAPVLPGKAQLLADYLSGGAPWLPFREMSFPEYLDTFPPVAVNAGMLVGHNTLRLMVMGLEDRAPTEAELDQMIALLEDGLRAGALGMSSGLFTPPGSFAKPDEMTALCAVLRRHNAAYFTHIRDEANRVMEACRGGDRYCTRLRCPCRDRAPQVLGSRQLGQGGTDPRQDRAARERGVRHRLRRLSLRRRRQPAEESAAALGAGRRQRGDAGTAAAAGDPRTHRAEIAESRAQQLGPHPVVGRGSDLHIAAPAADGRTDGRGARRGAGLRSRSTRSATI